MMTVPIHVPDGVAGDWKVSAFTVSKAEADLENIRAMIGRRPLSRIVPGAYKRLTYRGGVVMSNTPMEIITHLPLQSQAKRAPGHYLLNGLGLGMAVAMLLEIPHVERVTVVEKSEDVLTLSGPTYASDPRVELVHGDAFEYQPPKGTRFAGVWHDIWPTFCPDNIPEMSRLTRKYGRRADWQGSWGREECERMRRHW
jgi:hypothetical protein